MRFAIRPVDGTLPELSYGARGSELGCFVPNGVSWSQLNYGQGEGQVEIEGCEWGFYYGDPGQLSVILHAGEVSLERATSFVHEVAVRVLGEQPFVVSVVGVDS